MANLPPADDQRRDIFTITPVPARIVFDVPLDNFVSDIRIRPRIQLAPELNQRARHVVAKMTAALAVKINGRHSRGRAHRGAPAGLCGETNVPYRFTTFGAPIDSGQAIIAESACRGAGRVFRCSRRRRRHFRLARRPADPKRASPYRIGKGWICAYYGNSHLP